jgi:two-component system, chemotaxis family, chemotaxis protein CheY
MYLVHENTETLLNSFLEEIEPKPLSWRLISIEFQDCETLKSPLLQNLCLKNLHSFFEDTECKIFWHRPGFILVFFQGRAMPIEKCVEGFLKETEFKGFGRFFDILDLSIHWNALTKLVHRIFNTKAKVTTEEPQPEQQPNDTTPPSTPLPYRGFTIELSAEKIKHLAPMRKSRIKPLLLLVEDDPFTLQLVKLAFKENYEVIAAETARQALVYYQRHLPDMVFLDIQLPDGDGINLLQQMCAADDESYIVMLSSHSQKEKIMDCMNFGAKGFIAKPFTRQRLIDATDKFKETRKEAQGDKSHGT